MKNSQQSTVLLSLATTPLLGGVILAKVLQQNLIELGKSTEEVFRGERLPLLDFPEPEPKN